MHLPRQPAAGATQAVTADASPRNILRSRAPQPVLRKCDDTHIHRATTLRSQPLAALAVAHLGRLLPARHVSVAVLGRLRSAAAVPAVLAVVAAVHLALPRPHRLGTAPATAAAPRL